MRSAAEKSCPCVCGEGMTQLAIKSLAKAYGSFKVFDGLNLEAKAGEIVVIFGGSGTGKTILLRLIAGVEEPTSGVIEIGGHDVSDIAPEHRGVHHDIRDLLRGVLG